MKTKWIIFFIIIIILLCVILYFILRKKQKKQTQEQPNNLITIPAKWYSNYNIESMYHFPEEYYSHKPLFIPQDNSNPTIGFAFSGGGSRAAYSTMGILQALNSKSLLNNNTISYMSANSGSTWCLLPVLYEPISGSKYTVDSILGDYKDPFIINLSEKPIFPNFISLAVDAKIEPQINDSWWNDSIGISYFLRYGLYTPLFKNIIGYDPDSITNILKTLQLTSPLSLYSGITLRKNMPIPIAMSSVCVKNNFPNFTYIPFDSSPISSGFLTSISNTLPSDNNELKNYGGRISSYAFNSVVVPSSQTPDKTNNTTDILIDISQTKYLWDPVNISGVSSMAAGPQLITLPKSTAFGNKTIDLLLLEDYKIQTEFAKPVTSSEKMIDGYLTDDTAVLSLLVRKTQRIVSITNLQIDQLYGDLNLSISSYIAIINGEYQNNFGIITGVTGNSVSLKLLGKNQLNVSIDKLYLKSISLSNVANLFNKYEVFDSSVINYQKTINGMIENYANTGIFYFQGVYKTKLNLYLDIIVYDVEILWYCLSPCPNFMTSLSKTNIDIWNNIFNMPNICTVGPIFNSCDKSNPISINCSQSCNLEPIDEVINIENIISITNEQANGISSLTSWVTNQIIIPFITGKFGIPIPKPSPIPSFTPTKPLIPDPPVIFDRIEKILEIIIPVINTKIKTELDLGTYIYDINKIPDITPIPPIGTQDCKNKPCASVIINYGSMKINSIIFHKNIFIKYNTNSIDINIKGSCNISLSDFIVNFYISLSGYDMCYPWSPSTPCPIPPCNLPEVFGNGFGTDGYKYTKLQAEDVCKSYGTILSTKEQLIDAQKNGAQWCSTGWVANSDEACFPSQPGTNIGCGNGDNNVQYWTPSSGLAAVNCYGNKPVTGMREFNELQHKYNQTPRCTTPPPTTPHKPIQPLPPPAPTFTYKLETISSTFEINNFSLNIPIILSDDNFTVLNFAKSRINSIDINIDDNTYNPPLKDWLTTNILSFIVSDISLVFTAPIILPLLAALQISGGYDAGITVLESILDDIFKKNINTLIKPYLIQNIFNNPVKIPITCDLCQYSCPIDYPPSLFTCSNHGICNKNIGKCMCDGGWIGPTCSSCGPNWVNDGKCTTCKNKYGDPKNNCIACIPDCTNKHCNYIDGCGGKCFDCPETQEQCVPGLSGNLYCATGKWGYNPGNPGGAESTGTLQILDKTNLTYMLNVAGSNYAIKFNDTGTTLNVLYNLQGGLQQPPSPWDYNKELSYKRIITYPYNIYISKSSTTFLYPI